LFAPSEPPALWEAAFHVKHEGWTPEDLSPAQLASLDAYEALLREFAIARGMIAASDTEHLRTRHILDSLRAVPLIEEGADPVVDLGSGAGLPGVPIAVARPDLIVTLTEPRQGRAAFLELVTERLRLLNVRVFPEQAERSAGGCAVCCGRGFGDVTKTWAVAKTLLRSEGDLIYWAGKTFEPGHAPADARVRAIGAATLESGGPIVIMTQR
jgi:16S rRNA (guanine(527)-N(7))-methyltransferase RsmG